MSSSRAAPIHLAAGLVNGDDHDLVAELVGGLTSDYEAALGAGRRHRARMLLRLMAALVVVNVVQPSDVLTVLEAVVSSAIDIADAGAAGCLSSFSSWPGRRRCCCPNGSAQGDLHVWLSSETQPDFNGVTVLRAFPMSERAEGRSTTHHCGRK